MSMHTPGPWAESRTRQLGGPFDDNDLNSTHFWHVRVINGGNGDHVADVNLFCDCGDYTESSANARLIAAAPELLAALRELLAEFDSYDAAMTEIGRGHEDYGQQRAAARAAIAKAIAE